MLGSATAESVEHLIAWRLLTGLGVGGMLASLTTMVAEYSSDQRRQLAISILQSGYPVGAIIAGIVSVALLDSYGWRSIFVVGGVLSLAMIPLVVWRLPESVQYLLQKRPPDALDKVNSIMRRMGHSEVDALPSPPEVGVSTTGPFAVFERRFIGRTIAIWCAYLVTLSAWYVVTNWTPKVLVDAGLAQRRGHFGRRVDRVRRCLWRPVSRLVIAARHCQFHRCQLHGAGHRRDDIVRLFGSQPYANADCRILYRIFCGRIDRWPLHDRARPIPGR